MSEKPFFGLDRTAEPVRFTRPHCDYQREAWRVEKGVATIHLMSHCTLGKDHDGGHDMSEYYDVPLD